MRVSKIKTKSKPEKEWFWIPGELNLSRHGNDTHRGTEGHGTRNPLPRGTPVDEGSAGNVADEKDIHAATARGVQEGHARHGQRHEGIPQSRYPS